MKRLSLLAVDLALVVLATFCAIILRDNLAINADSLANALPYFASTVTVAIAALWLSGASSSIWRFSNLNDYVSLCVATVIIVGGAMALTFIGNRLDGVARSVPILQALLILLLLVGVRVSMRLRHAERRQPPKVLTANATGDGSQIATLVVGMGPLADAYLRSVSEFVDHRIRVVGILSRDQRQVGRHLFQSEIIGVADKLHQVIRDLAVHGITIDRLVVAAPIEQFSATAQTAIRELAATSEIEIDYLFQRLTAPFESPADPPEALASISTEKPALASELADEAEKQPPPSAALKGGDSWRLASENSPYFSVSALQPQKLRKKPYWRVKRTFDAIFAFVLLLALLPVFAVVALVVALSMGMPVTFWQQRPGLGGRPFRVYKFRTMTAAHDRHGQLREDTDRLNAVGAFLRRTRLDELPQLFSILIGDMSFVGPRPLLPRDQAPEFKARLLVRPGMTGWAQVIGGRAISARDKAALDVWYVRNASLYLDAAICVRTLGIVLTGERLDQARIDAAVGELRRAKIYVEQPPKVIHGDDVDVASRVDTDSPAKFDQTPPPASYPF